MKRTIIVLVLLFFRFSPLYGQLCRDSDRTKFTQPTNKDTKEHITGDHHFDSFFGTVCRYQSTAPEPSQFCDVLSATDASATPFESGDTTPILHSHFIGSDAKGGQQTGVNGATATTSGLTAAAVLDCVISCAVELSISGSDNGVGLTVKFPASPVWSKTATTTGISCGPILDPTLNPGGGGGDCEQDLGDGSGFMPLQTCGDTSPILIDTEGEGFHLTSAENGVMFDIRGDGHPVKIAWTAPGSHNAFLVLDRDGSGSITSGKELFGNFTTQPKNNHPNGFLALAEYDKPENGGNGDGVMDEQDAIFSRLRLWIDASHDGISQSSEFHTLPEWGIHSLSLSYFDSNKTDEFGNRLRYKARVNPRKEHRDGRDEKESGEVGRWAYDVFFVTK